MGVEVYVHGGRVIAVLFSIPCHGTGLFLISSVFVKKHFARGCATALYFLNNIIVVSLMVSPCAASDFFLRAQKEVTKKKDTPG